MPLPDSPYFSLAVTPLQIPGAAHFAIHVTRAPYPGGLALHNCIWTNSLSQLWQLWQEMFFTHPLPPYPLEQTEVPDISLDSSQPGGMSARLMQTLGVSLWQWLFDGSIMVSLNQSRGIAIGQGHPLRLQIEIRDPMLISLPWEIMQEAPGTPAISLNQHIFFSRTTSDVFTLPPARPETTLKILLVQGQASDSASGAGLTNEAVPMLKLEQEADMVAQVLKRSGNSGIGGVKEIPCEVRTLVQPTPIELIQALETRNYNVLFYAGHGMPGPDGGVLFVRPDMPLNGTELAQVLTRCQVKLAVFNACWGAQSDHYYRPDDSMPGGKIPQPIPRSSLAEVLIHHGVPAVLGMRNSITDQEALSFIQEFAKALAERKPIDQAVAIARQHLLAVYKFNQQAWTLPVLYMHPEFDGELLAPIAAISPGNTQIGPESAISTACLRSLDDNRVWQIRGGYLTIGRSADNDLILREDEAGSSREHAMILRRENPGNFENATYFLRDVSRFGTWVSLDSKEWQRVHQQEVILTPGCQIKFGSIQNKAMEFILLGTSDTPPLS